MNATKPCPTSEALAAYVDGACAVEERVSIEDHVSRCDDCYELVRESLSLAAGSPPFFRGQPAQRLNPAEATPDTRGRRWLWLAAALALAIGGAWLGLGRSPSSGRASLVAALGPQRLFEARLTGGFAFGPLRVASRTTLETDRSAEWALLAAAGEAQARAEQRPSRENRIALASALLLRGDAPAAIETLESLAQERAEAGVLSDLAAAYLVRASRQEQPQDGTRALAAATRALAMDPALVEARYNRALALELLGQEAEAVRAWQEYLATDPASEWAAEAKARVARLSARPQAVEGPR